ncbi:hypothetical protein [Nocardioides pacificus]
MSISLRVDGRAGPCRRTARQLTRTSQAIADAADCLVRERHRSVDGLDGGAGLAYRERVTTSANDAEMLSRCVARLGRGLDELAGAIEDVRDRMDRARDLVEPYDLLRGDRIREPVDEDGDDPHLVRARRLAYRDAADLVRQARKDEKEAQDEWRATLASYAIELGEDMVPGIPSGLFLPPVEDAPTQPQPQPPTQPQPRPRVPDADVPGSTDSTGAPPSGDQQRATHAQPAPPPEPDARDHRPPAGPPGGTSRWTLAGVTLGGPALGGHVLGDPVLGGHVLGGHVLDEGRPNAQLAESHPLDPAPTELVAPAESADQGDEPGCPPHLEVLHAPRHPPF